MVQTHDIQHIQCVIPYGIVDITHRYIFEIVKRVFRIIEGVKNMI